MVNALVSICIPTYNRAHSLTNCLQSIAVAAQGYAGQFEVCISDNGSDDETQRIVTDASSLFELRYHRNDSNVGIPKNFIQVVSMARGEFVWLLGDDDLLLPDTLERLLPLLREKDGIDFFYLNSFHLHKSYIDSKPHPFDTNSLPTNMLPFSKKNDSCELKFFELIDPAVSFDFLGGMFLSAFRKSNWDTMACMLDQSAIDSNVTFSHFDNTFPHLKIWAHAFSSSRAYFNAAPMNICITGIREWAPMEPLVSNIRLLEALDAYRNNGMSLWRYIYCKNFALRHYTSGMLSIILHRDLYSFKLYLLRHYLKCCLYPNVYFSAFTLLFRKSKELLFKVKIESISLKSRF